MRNRQYGQCLEEKPHARHLFYPGFFRRKVICIGLALDPWRKANPSIGMVVLPKGLTLPEEVKPHKHFFKLVNFFVGKYYARHIIDVRSDRYGWECECGATLTRDRYELMLEMRPAWKNLEQTWPS